MCMSCVMVRCTWHTVLTWVSVVKLGMGMVTLQSPCAIYGTHLLCICTCNFCFLVLYRPSLGLLQMSWVVSKLFLVDINCYTVNFNWSKIKDNIHTGMCLETVIFSHKSKHNRSFNHIDVCFLKEYCMLLYYPFTPEPMEWPFHHMFRCNKIFKYLL